MLAARFIATCAAMSSSLGMVMSLLDSLDLLAIKPWLTLDSW